MTELYKNKLQGIFDSIEYEGQDDRIIQITVYVLDGVTVRTSIKTENKEYLLDLDTTNGKTLSFKIVTGTETGEDEKLYLLGKSTNQDVGTRTIKYEDLEKSMELNVDVKSQEDGLMVNINGNYTDETISNLSIQGNMNFTVECNQILPRTYKDNSNILLNDYEGDKIKSILNDLKERLVKKIEESQTKINTKMINNIINWNDKIEQQISEKEKNEIEAKKQAFNNKFVLYEGEDLEYEVVQNLLKVVQQNMSDYRVISGKEIQIIIEEGKENEKKAEIISKQLSESYTYNIKALYDDEGYVKAINISVYEDEN